MRIGQTDDFICIDHYGQMCETCGNEMSWEDCGVCGGDGEREVYEDDPLWYLPGDVEMCHTCDGDGGFWTCSACRAKWHEEQEKLPHL